MKFRNWKSWLRRVLARRPALLAFFAPPLLALLLTMATALTIQRSQARGKVAPQRVALASQRIGTAARRAGVKREQLERFLRAGIVLQPRQLAASAAARLCDAEDGPWAIGYGGARGGGKSHWVIAQVAVDDCQRQPGLKVLLLRKSGKAIKEQFRDLRRLLKRVPHTWIPSQGSGVLEFPNGSRIILGHFKDDRDIDAYLGLEYDLIVIEEATTLSKTKVEDILTCLRTSKPNWRPRVYMTTNPGNIGHAWFKALFIEPSRRGQETETRFVSATIDDNSFVDKGYKAKLDRMTGWKKKAWRYGDWDVMAGQFFTTFRAEHEGKPHHVVSLRDTLGGLPPHWEVWLALDHGFTHYTVIYLLAKDGDGNVYLVDEIAVQRTLVKRICEMIDAMLSRNNVLRERLKTFVAGHDVFAVREGGETIADKYEREGFPLTPARIARINGAAEILEGVVPEHQIRGRCRGAPSRRRRA